MRKKVSTMVRRVTLSISFAFSVPLMRRQVCRFYSAGNTFQFFVKVRVSELNHGGTSEDSSALVATHCYVPPVPVRTTYMYPKIRAALWSY